MKEKEIQQKVAEGYVRANIIFEVIGNPKSYVENALKNYVESLKKEKDVEFIHEDYEKPEEQDKYWSTFAEIEMLVKGLEKFTWICFNYMPASIEILEPEALTFQGRDLTNWINDMLAKLHEISTVAQQVGSENKLMLQNINAIMRNAVLTCIDFKVRTGKEIAAKIGVSEKDLKPVLEAMIKEKKIKKEGKKYHRIR